jgi:hypothetical protein
MLWAGWMIEKSAESYLCPCREGEHGGVCITPHTLNLCGGLIEWATPRSYRITPTKSSSRCNRTGDWLRSTFPLRREYLSPFPEIKPRFLHLQGRSINGQERGSPEPRHPHNKWDFSAWPRGWVRRFHNKTVQHIFVSYHILYKSRDRAVGIATVYGLDDRGVGLRVPVGSRIFSSP